MENEKKHLYILWTNGDPVTSEHMVMMYATNSMRNKWWDQVTVIIWGHPQTLVVENEAIALKLEIAQSVGVEFSACLTCVLNLGTREALEDKGIEVIRWGEKLSHLMQEGEHVLSI